MKFFLAGKWQERDERIEVKDPSTGQTIDSVPKATETDVLTALSTAEKARTTMSSLTGYERFQILRRTADLLTKNKKELARKGRSNPSQLGGSQTY